MDTHNILRDMNMLPPPLGGDIIKPYYILGLICTYKSISLYAFQYCRSNTLYLLFFRIFRMNGANTAKFLGMIALVCVGSANQLDRNQTDLDVLVVLPYRLGDYFFPFGLEMAGPASKYELDMPATRMTLAAHIY